MGKKLWQAFSSVFLMLVSWGLLGLLGLAALFAFLLKNYTNDIPDFNRLQNYQPPVVTRVFTSDGQLMAEFAEEKRVFVPFAAVPELVKNAFMSAEDRNFYTHEGLDFMGIARAVLINIRNIGSDSRMVGASTITQQVAKNLLLTNEVSFERKFKEAILALRMERVLSKEKIFELYLNQIYLGQGSYGIAAAAQNYFNKGLDELTLTEAAYLAALPKGPNNYDPVKRHQQAVDRRNWVLARMHDDGHVTEDQMKMAQMTPLETVSRAQKQAVRAPYFAEEIRRFLGEKMGQQSLYTEGLIVRSTLDPKLQEIAERAFRYGITLYDRRHGWRGPIARFDTLVGWQQRLEEVPFQKGMLPDWQIAVVTKKTEKSITVGIAGGEEHALTPDDAKFAADAKVGDIVMAGPHSYLDDVPMQKMPADEDGNVPPVPTPEQRIAADKYWHIRQVPVVQGGLVAMDPYTGRVLAMQGGWDYEKSEFNRVTQAMRQVGSAFKPFEYIAALEDGYTPSTKILDAPVSFSMGYGQGVWSPGNYEEGEYGGPTTIRVCVEKSRNLPTVRLAAHLGMDRIAQTVERFGVYDPMDKYLSNSLGAQETTLLKLATGYAMIANGGQKITPTFIDRIQNREGVNVYARDSRLCPDCGPRIAWEAGQPVPQIKKDEDLVTDPRVAYQMTSILSGVPRRGTAVRNLSDIDYPIAGKTGTTNEERDAWFIGYTPEIVVGMYVGFDTPKPMGHHETGGAVAAPMFRSFIVDYMKGREALPFRIPDGISLVQVNARTGQRTTPDDPQAIMEAFLTDREPDAGPAPEMATPEANDAYVPTGTDAPAVSTDSIVRPSEDQGPAMIAPPPSNALGGTGGVY